MSILGIDFSKDTGNTVLDIHVYIFVGNQLGTYYTQQQTTSLLPLFTAGLFFDTARMTTTPKDPQTKNGMQLLDRGVEYLHLGARYVHLATSKDTPAEWTYGTCPRATLATYM